MKHQVEMGKFKFAELFNNSQGKTSLPLLCGAIIIATGCAVFAVCGTSLVINSWFKYGTNPDIQALALQAVAMVTVGTSMLIVRRLTPEKKLAENTENPIA